MRYPKILQDLIDNLASLPGVGRKTAERYALFLLKQGTLYRQILAQNINNLNNQDLKCHTCQLISETNPCSICADEHRDASILCVVENSQDLMSIESTKRYQGKYFILDGLIDTLHNIGPEELNTKKLLQLLKDRSAVKEIILALNFTLEGETTALYLTKLLKDRGFKISRLAKGLPAGADLEYADPNTLSSALEFRNEIKK